MNSPFSTRPSTPTVVRALILINVLAYFLYLFADEQGATEILALHNWLSPYFRPWQLITGMFLHSTSSLFHLFFNMLALWMFGSAMEMRWGPQRFLAYYLICGIGASVLHNTVVAYQLHPMLVEANVYLNAPGYTSFEAFISNHLPGSYNNNQLNEFLVAWYNDRLNPGYINESISLVNEVVDFRTNMPTVGASGAVYGLLLAFGMTFPNAMILLLIPPIPLKAKYLVIVYGLIELSMGIRNNLEDNVAHFAHLGGMLFGVLLILYYRKQDGNRYVN